MSAIQDNGACELERSWCHCIIGVERRFEVSQGESESNPQRLFPSIISSISYRLVRRLMW